MRFRPSMYVTTVFCAALMAAIVGGHRPLAWAEGGQPLSKPSTVVPNRPAAVGERYTVDLSALPAPYSSPAVANSAQGLARTDSMRPQVPAGLRVTLFAEGLSHARWLAVAPDGALFLAESRAGRITVLRDRQGDGRADERSQWVEGLNRPHGMAFGHGGVYIADRDAVWFTPYQSGASAAGSVRQITPQGALGDPGGHWTRTLALSADQRTLYVAIGSRSNMDPEEIPRATIQAFSLAPDGLSVVRQYTYASGLRNAVGLALHPGDGKLWTVVNERDGLGDELVPDYLTDVADGDFFGWPYTYLGDHPQPGLAADPYARVARVPALPFHSHSAPLGLAFLPPQGIAQAMEAKTGEPWTGDAIVALHGSWNAATPRGYFVARVPLQDGTPRGWYEVLVSGFRLPATRVGERNAGAVADPAQVWGRPAGLAVDRQGALYVADDLGQTIWKISPE